MLVTRPHRPSRNGEVPQAAKETASWRMQTKALSPRQARQQVGLEYPAVCCTPAAFRRMRQPAVVVRVGRREEEAASQSGHEGLDAQLHASHMPKETTYT
jgi:hypothetical protein